MVKPVEIENLNFAYPDGTEVLRGITLSVDEGECLGLIGPNGAGKTTLLLHLNGILRGEGKIKIYGQDIIDENLSFVRSKVGVVFQDPDTQLFMPTVFDDVAFGPIHMDLGLQEIKSRVAKALLSVDMASYTEKISHHLSFGEKKRISLATVLSMDSKILVLDEPTSNLDPKHRGETIGILKELPATKIIASHDLDMIWRLADRVIVLAEGRILACGKTDEVLKSDGVVKQFALYQ